MSAENEKSDSIIGVVGSTGKDAAEKSGNVVKSAVDSVKVGAQNLLDKVTFWKKEKTPEEILADVQKKYNDIEEDYKAALEKAAKAKTEEKKKAMEEKAAAKRDKKLKSLQEKHAQEYAVVTGQKASDAPDNASPVAASAGQSETKSSSEKKNLLQKITFWLKKKTPEERQEICEGKLAKALENYEKDMAEAAKAKTEEKRKEKEQKALDSYKKRMEKIEKKYPDAVAKIKAEVEAAKKAAEEKEAAEKAAADKAAAEKAAAEKAAADKAAAEKAAQEKVAAEQKLAEQSDKKFQARTASRDARSKVSASPEERKTDTLKKWMKEVHLPEETAQQMIDKYGLDMAYRLTQRCMLEPNNLMPEIDSQFKKASSTSAKSIQYFLELDTKNADNQAKVSKATGLEFVKKTGNSSQEDVFRLGVSLLPKETSKIPVAPWQKDKGK